MNQNNIYENDKNNLEKICEIILKKKLKEDIIISNFHIQKDNINNILIMKVLFLFNKLKNENQPFLNIENLKKTFNYSELNPINVKNVFTKEINNILKLYISKINKKIFKPGDSACLKRYVYNDDIITRFLHIKLLPLIENIINKKLVPTYTYLSLYRKGAELDIHSDRKECEYTVSYLIDKSEDSNWAIYFNKKRGNMSINKNDLLELYCNNNEFLLFEGINHLHFRNELKFDYYNILLFHYNEKK